MTTVNLDTSQTYDNQGRPLAVTYPDGKTYTYAYGGMGVIVGVFPSSYSSQYQDGVFPSSDQGHHFAAFFQLGYNLGKLNAGQVAGIKGYITEAENGFMNAGDINLAIKAASLGSQLGNSLSTKQIGQAIRDQICAK